MLMHPAIAQTATQAPLSAYRATAEPGKPVTPPAVTPVAPVVAQVHIVEFPTGTVPYGTLERAKDAAERYNANRGPDSPELRPVVAQAIVVTRGIGRPRCQIVPVEFPKDLWGEFCDRCQQSCTDPARILAGLILTQLVCNRGPDKYRTVAQQIDKWEHGKRKFGAWQSPTESGVTP